MPAYLLIDENLHFIHSDFLALYFADDGTLFGIFHPSRQAQLIARILAEFGEVDACSRHSQEISERKKKSGKNTILKMIRQETDENSAGGQVLSVFITHTRQTQRQQRNSFKYNEVV